MPTRKNATISPDRAAGDPDLIVGMVVQNRSNRAKRQQEEADIHDGTGGTGPAAKVARLASAMSLASAMTEEGKKEQAADVTPLTPLPTTEKIMNILKDLWSDDDECVIKRAVKEIADIGARDAPPYENELKICMLGGQTAVFHALKKHIACIEIQAEGMRAVATLSRLMQTKKLLGDIGCVEVILASMEKYPDSEYIQMIGCYLITSLVGSIKANAERVEKSGGIAVVIAAMKANPNSKELQKYGCSVLLPMSQCAEYRPLIVEAGGVSAIALVVERYRDDPELRRCSYPAMKLLFTE
jgi:hypothetical protein